MVVDKGRESISPHYKDPYRFHGDHAGGTHPHLEPAAFADELAGATFGQDTFPAEPVLDTCLAQEQRQRRRG
jgi:hypothetical protein